MAHEQPRSGDRRIEDRMGMILGLLVAAGGVAVALGFQTPVARLAKAETTIAEHETRIQKIEDQRETLESIARAVGAPIIVKRR